MSDPVIHLFSDREKTENTIKQIEADEDGGWTYRMVQVTPNKFAIYVYDDEGKFVGRF